MDAGVGHMHAAQAFVQILGEAGRTAEVEVVVVQWQRGLDLLDAQAVGELVVMTQHGLGFGLAQGTMDAQQAIGVLLECGKLLLERQVGQCAPAMEQMDAPPLPFGQLLAEHGDQRGDADARADQHKGPLTLLIQGKAAHGLTHLQPIANLHLLMQIA